MIVIPLLIKAVVWLGTMGIAAYGVKKVTQVFGSTPANDLKQQVPQLERMSPKEMYSDRKEWRQDRIKYHKKRNAKIQSEIDKLNKKIDFENEEKTKVLKQIQESNDPAEKTRLTQKLASIEKNIGEYQKRLNNLNKNKENAEKKIDEVYDKFDDSLSQEQFVSQANSINWTSYKNYGIIFICIIVVIMVIGMLKKLLGSLMSSIK